MTQSPQTNAKGFSKAFWVSNTVELFERMAYYAVFIVLTIYLSNILGFNDFEASMISGLFSGGLYLLPIFTGAYADKIGFRKSMIIAFSLLSAGYLGLGVLPTLLEAAGLVEYGEVTRFSGLADSSERWMIVPVLFVIMLGGEAIEHENFSSIVNDIGLLHSLGIRLVVVYGARPQIDANLAAHHHEPLYHKNIRVTDAKTLELVKQAAGTLTEDRR